MVTVYETDQWTSTQIKQQKLTVADLEKAGGEVYGGDADTVRALFGGGKVIAKEVSENAGPSIGHVWFKADEAGNLVLWRARYDSSG